MRLKLNKRGLIIPLSARLAMWREKYTTNVEIGNHGKANKILRKIYSIRYVLEGPNY